MDIYDEIENLTRGLPPDQKILEANRLKNIYCNIGYMDTESQRLRKLRSHGITTTLNAELNIAPDSDITLTQQFLDNFPANYNRYMEAYKHSIRLLSDLQQLYAIIVVNMNKGESYLFKGNDQISNFFSIFKDRLYPQLQPLDRTSNYLFLYCSNDIDIFIAKKALNLCSIHQVTPIDMAQIRRIQKAQKTVEKHDATQIPQTMINRPLGESGKNDGKSTELPNVTTASGSMIKESNVTKESSMISDLNLEPAMKKRKLSDPNLSGRETTPPKSDIYSSELLSQGSTQHTHPSTDQTSHSTRKRKLSDLDRSGTESTLSEFDQFKEHLEQQGKEAQEQQEEELMSPEELRAKRLKAIEKYRKETGRRTSMVPAIVLALEQVEEDHKKRLLRYQQEKELSEKEKREAREQQEKELVPQTPTRELEFTTSPTPTQLSLGDLSRSDISPIKETDASKSDIEESESQTPSPSTSKEIMEETSPIKETDASKEDIEELEFQTPSPSASKEISEETPPKKRTRARKRDTKEPEFQTPSPSISKELSEEIQGSKKPLKETVHTLSPISAKRFNRLSAIAKLRPDSSAIPYISYKPTKQEMINTVLVLNKFDREKARELAGKIFNFSHVELAALKKVYKIFKEKNKTLEDQMNFILQFHQADESDLTTFFEFAANYTILTGEPIVSLKDNQIYEELKNKPAYTKEACNYVASILSKIKSIINVAIFKNIKIRSMTKEFRSRLTHDTNQTIERLKTITKKR